MVVRCSALIFCILVQTIAHPFGNIFFEAKLNSPWLYHGPQQQPQQFQPQLQFQPQPQFQPQIPRWQPWDIFRVQHENVMRLLGYWPQQVPQRYPNPNLIPNYYPTTFRPPPNFVLPPSVDQPSPIYGQPPISAPYPPAGQPVNGPNVLPLSTSTVGSWTTEPTPLTTANSIAASERVPEHPTTISPSSRTEPSTSTKSLSPESITSSTTAPSSLTDPSVSIVPLAAVPNTVEAITTTTSSTTTTEAAPTTTPALPITTTPPVTQASAATSESATVAVSSQAPTHASETTSSVSPVSPVPLAVPPAVPEIAPVPSISAAKPVVETPSPTANEIHQENATIQPNAVTTTVNSIEHQTNSLPT